MAKNGVKSMFSSRYKYCSEIKSTDIIECLDN